MEAVRDLNFKDTELCLGLPGGGGGDKLGHEVVEGVKKRGFSETIDLKLNLQSKDKPVVDLNEELKNNSVCQEPKLLSASTKDPAKPPAK